MICCSSRMLTVALSSHITKCHPNPTVLESLSSKRFWTERVIHDQPFRCTFRELASTLGIEYSGDEHVCTELSKKKFGPTIGGNINVFSRVHANDDYIINACLKGVRHLEEKIAIAIDTTVLCRDLHAALTSRRLTFLKSSQLKSISNMLCYQAVTTEIDKCSTELCVMCPHLFSLRMAGLWFRKIPHAFVQSPLAYHRLRSDMMKLLHCTGVPLAQKHSVGLASLIPKASSLRGKERPLGSFFNHEFKRHFSNVGRILSFMCTVVAEGMEECDTSVLSSKRIRKKIDKINSSKAHLPTSGLKSFVNVRKSNLDGFYNAIDRSTIADSINYIVSRFIKLRPR